MKLRPGQILLIADSHLAGDPESAENFFSVLEKISGTPADIAFLGDIFEMWIGYPGYEFPVHRRFMEWCRKEKAVRKIYFLEGNHEFYIARTHADLFTDVSDLELSADDGKLCLMHGDTINVLDKRYLLLRNLLRNPVSRALVRFAGWTFGAALSEIIRKRLKTTNMQYKKYYPESEIAELETRLKARGFSCAAAGHFHQEKHGEMLTVLPDWSAPDYRTGLYTDGKGIEIFPARELFGE